MASSIATATLTSICNSISNPRRIIFSGNTSKFPSIQFPTNAITYSCRLVNAMAERNRNLDRLPRSESVPKNNLLQTAPTGGQWDRFPAARTVQQMMDTMERMLEDPLAYSSSWPSQQRERNSYRKGRAPWDISEEEDKFLLRFDMPGMNRKDVRVSVEEQMLVVKAEKRGSESEEEEKQPPWGNLESFGKYSTRISLPENVEFEKIVAEVRDGVLYITMPKVSKTTQVLDINVH